MRNRTVKAIAWMGLALSLVAQSPQEGLAAKKAGDVARAVQIFEALAAKQDVRAMNTLGPWYHQGDGVKADPARAYDWYLKAAELGDGDGWNNLGVLFRDGLGVKQDGELAFALFRAVTAQAMGRGGVAGVETQNRAAINGNRLYEAFGPERSRALLDWTPAYLRACLQARSRVKEVPRDCQPMIGVPSLWAIAVLEDRSAPPTGGVKLTRDQNNLAEHLLVSMPQGVAREEARALLRAPAAEAEPVLKRVLAHPDAAHPLVLIFAGVRRFDQGEPLEGARWAYAGTIRLFERMEALSFPEPARAERLAGLVAKHFASHTWIEAGRDLAGFGKVLEEVLAWDRQTREGYLAALAQEPEVQGRLKAQVAWDQGPTADLIKVLTETALSIRKDPESVRQRRTRLKFSNEPLPKRS